MALAADIAFNKLASDPSRAADVRSCIASPERGRLACSNWARRSDLKASIQRQTRRATGCRHRIEPARLVDRSSKRGSAVSTIRLPQYLAFPGVLGNGIASRTLDRPVTY